MRDFVADRLLMVSTWLYQGSVWCKDAALRVLTFKRRRSDDRA